MRVILRSSALGTPLFSSHAVWEILSLCDEDLSGMRPACGDTCVGKPDRTIEVHGTKTADRRRLRPITIRSECVFPFRRALCRARLARE
jgi:hypothetical protein